LVGGCGDVQVWFCIGAAGKIGVLVARSAFALSAWSGAVPLRAPGQASRRYRLSLYPAGGAQIGLQLGLQQRFTGACAVFISLVAAIGRGIAV
jgi:hypothetical protein